VVVVVDVIMHARFERINAIGPFEMEVLGFQGAEEASNRRVVEAVALGAQPVYAVQAVVAHPSADLLLRHRPLARQQLRSAVPSQKA